MEWLIYPNKLNQLAIVNMWGGFIVYPDKCITVDDWIFIGRL